MIGAPDLEAARAFLAVLAPRAQGFTFQTFADSKTSQSPASVVRTLNGTLDAHSAALGALNAQGAGVFVTVNETDLTGRKAGNIRRVRTVFVDTDGAPLRPIIDACKAAQIKPAAIIESSPGKFHVYWLADCELDQFKPVQQALAAKFGTDQSVCDLPRVMRLPGFFHCKDGKDGTPGTPFQTRALRLDPNAPAYSVDELCAGLALTLGTQHVPVVRHSAAAPLPENNDLIAGTGAAAARPETSENVKQVRGMLAVIPCNERGHYSSWRRCVWAVAALGWACGEDLAREWSKTGGALYDEGVFQQVWKDYDPARPGGIGFGTLRHVAAQHGWVDPVPPAPAEGGGDVSNGRLFARLNRGKLLFIHETGGVLEFDATAGWISAQPGAADIAAKAVSDRLHLAAADAYKQDPEAPKTKTLMRHAAYTSKAQSIKAMIALARSEPGMTAQASEFDSNPWQFGVANGVIDLRTRTLLPVSPELRVSKRGNVTYEPGAECPVFLQFMETVQPDAEVREFLQRLAGYTLTGLAVEHKLFFLYGTGRNGKSVFIELLAWILGGYAGKIATEMLMHHKRDPGAASPDIVRLKGSRLAYANETEEGCKLAHARVKDFTGGDSLEGRAPYATAPISFQPTHKLFMLGNHRPDVADMSEGMWARMCLIPFDVTIPAEARDLHLIDKLKAESSGVLNWMLDGLAQYQRHGLRTPAVIAAAVDAYKDDMDILGDWLREHCDLRANAEEDAHKVYLAYTVWAKTRGHAPVSSTRLTRRLSSRGVPKSDDRRKYRGLSLNSDGLLAAARGLNA